MAILDRYSQELIQALRESDSDSEIVSGESIRLGGRPAKELIISTQEQYNYHKISKSYTIRDCIAYIIGHWMH